MCTHHIRITDIRITEQSQEAWHPHQSEVGEPSQVPQVWDTTSISQNFLHILRILQEIMV